MKLTYDPRHNVAYMRLREPSTEVQTLRISEELFIDIAPDGSVYGFEFLNANEQLRSADGGQFVLIDSIHGTKHSFPLPPAAE
jgi:uncharacterized protein YuzE